MSNKEVFRRAAELISSPGSWAQGNYAKTSDGNCVLATSPHAKSWCVLGAIQRVTDLDMKLYEPCRNAATKKARDDGWAGCPTCTTWNDAPTRTQAEVVAFLEALADEN